MNPVSARNARLVGLAGAFASLLLASSGADAAPRCSAGTYAATETPLIAGADAADQIVIVSDGMVSIPGCEPAEVKFRESATGRVRITARWTSCAGVAEPIRLDLKLKSDCQRGTGVLRFGKPVSARKRFKAEGLVPKPEVLIDPAVVPSVDALPSEDAPGFVAGEERPVAAMTDETGVTTEFVANELVVQTEDREALDAFLARWNGTILSSLSLAEAGLEGPTTHVVRIDPSRADTSRLIADLKALNPEQTNELRVSSEAALQVMAASASEKLDGLAVGLNYVAGGEAYRDRVTSDGFGNAFMIDYLRGNCRVPEFGGCADAGVEGPSTAVTEAWRALDAAGRLGNRVTVAVIDRGFSSVGTGLGAFTHLTPGDLNLPNAVEATKPWHGTMVAQTIAAVANDGVGVAGVAGPVANLLTITSNSLIQGVQGVVTAWQNGARIINMSFSARIPAVQSVGDPTLRVFDEVTRQVARRGVLIFASAGNAQPGEDRQDVDHEECYLGVCWEEAWWTPCENDGVLCVAGLNDVGQVDIGSNYGPEDVDFYAPFTVLVGPTPGANFTYPVSGTSFSSPFVAGVAALVWAANPNASPEYVSSILRSEGNWNAPPAVGNTINAYKPVIKTLGGTPPDVKARLVNGAIRGLCGPQFAFEAEATDADGNLAGVTWTSDRDGTLGQGFALQTSLSVGTHRIRAVATDKSGFTAGSNEIVVSSTAYSLPRPTMAISAPQNHQVFTTNQVVTLEVSGTEAATEDGLLLSRNVNWYLGTDKKWIASGRRTEVFLPEGFHYLFAHYTPPCGGSEIQDFKLVEVVVRADSPPGMVVSLPTSSTVTGWAENGQLCLRVSGFGWDEDAQDFLTLTWWETDRNDLQLKLLTWNQTDTVCLKAVPGRYATIHNIRLIGIDAGGQRGESVPIKVVIH